MAIRSMKFIAVVLLFAAFMGPVLYGQTPEEKPKSSQEPAPSNGLNLQPSVAQSMATIERMIEVAVQGVAARYNLNEEQRRHTEEIMKRDVQKFLKDHEAEVWPLIRDLLAAQLGTKPPSDPEEVKRLGKACRPLVKLAQEAIVKGNLEWRDQVLSAEQKKTHDYDMAEMNKTFKQIDRNFAEWEEGRTTNKSLFPQQDPRKGPPTPPRPAFEGLPEPVTETIVSTDTIFDTFVDQFIKDYLLDEGQVVSARSILREIKDKAADFKNNNKDDLARLSKDMKDARDQRDNKKRSDSEAEYKKLIQPVHEMFAQMEVRLRGLLNSGQLEKYNANNLGLDPTMKTTARNPADAVRKETPEAAKSAVTPPPAVSNDTPAADKPQPKTQDPKNKNADAAPARTVDKQKPADKPTEAKP